MPCARPTATISGSTVTSGRRRQVPAIVSVQDGQTYVYFTSNNNPGGIYRYRVGDRRGRSFSITPDTANQNYCMSSVSVGSDGSLYYTNDSGKLFAIKGNGERLKRYTVTFDANGKDVELPASQRVKQGHLALEPSVQLTYAGYTFAGWYKDADCTQAWDFSKDVVTADMTLYASGLRKRALLRFLRRRLLIRFNQGQHLFGFLYAQLSLYRIFGGGPQEQCGAADRRA